MARTISEIMTVAPETIEASSHLFATATWVRSWYSTVAISTESYGS